MGDKAKFYGMHQRSRKPKRVYTCTQHKVESYTAEDAATHERLQVHREHQHDGREFVSYFKGNRKRFTSEMEADEYRTEGTYQEEVSEDNIIEESEEYDSSFEDDPTTDIRYQETEPVVTNKPKPKKY